MSSWLRFITVKGHEAQSAQGKGVWGQAQGRPGISFQDSFSLGVTQDVPNSLQQCVVMTCAKGCLPGNPVTDWPRWGRGGCSGRHTLPGMYQHSYLPERKQEFSMNPTVYVKSLGTVSHSHQVGNGGNPLQILIPRHSQGPAWVAGLSREKQSALPCELLFAQHESHETTQTGP